MYTAKKQTEDEVSASQGASTRHDWKERKRARNIGAVCINGVVYRIWYSHDDEAAAVVARELDALCDLAACDTKQDTPFATVARVAVLGEGAPRLAHVAGVRLSAMKLIIML